MKKIFCADIHIHEFVNDNEFNDTEQCSLKLKELLEIAKFQIEKEKRENGSH